MSLLVWNCRGLGNLVTKKELGEITQAKDPSVMFIAETWVDEDRLKTGNLDYLGCVVATLMGF